MFGRLILMGAIFGGAFAGGVACALLRNQRRAQREILSEDLAIGGWQSEDGAPIPVLF